MSAPATTFPINSEIRSLSAEKIEKFVTFCGREVTKLKPLLKSEQRYDDSFFYAYSSLRAYPLVRIPGGSTSVIVCPLPTLLFWRFTGGLYYDLVDDVRFGNEYGRSFQRYVGEVIQRASPGTKIRLLPEQSYGTKQRRKDTVDWVVVDGESALFIECKAKRLSWGAKIALDDLGPLERDIELMAEAVVQVYKTIGDYRANQYPHLTFDTDLAIYPIVVTLESWHLFASLFGILNRSICAKLEAARLPQKLLDEMPFAIWDVSELERGIQIINHVGIRTFVTDKINDPEMRHWEWHSYMRSRFPDEPNKQLFGDEYQKMFAPIGL